MKDKNGNSHPGVSFATIDFINRIKFTPREIDVLACILGGRTAKKIGILLTLSPKTVENYIHNIKVKLQCNSQESIRDFLEKSDQVHFLRQHYLTFTSPETINEIDISSLNESSSRFLNNRSMLWGNILKQKKWFYLIPTAIMIISFFLTGIIFLDRMGGLRWGQHNQAIVHSDFMIPTSTTFLERPNLMAQIDGGLKKKEGIQTVALIGMGGAGKTTLAHQYARHEKASIIWEINAETRESLISSFEELANSLAKTEEDKLLLKHTSEIKNNQERDEKVLLFVKERLKLQPGWILLFDNVEQFNFIQDHFPNDLSVWGNGKVILTTRDSNIQNCIYINFCIKVGELSLDDRLNLFVKNMNNEGTHQITSDHNEEAKKFLEHVPPYPLDVIIAAQYLKNTKTSYSEYLSFLYDNDQNFINTQEDIITSVGDYSKTRYGIIRLSLEKIIAKNDDFIELLLVLALVDSQNIPKFFLERFKKVTTVNELMQSLKKYSLISSEPLNFSQSLPTFSIHRSTQEMFRTYLIKKLDLKRTTPLLESVSKMMERYIYVVACDEDFPKMRVLISHIERFLKHQNLLTDEEVGCIGCELAGFYIYLHKYKQAKDILIQSQKLLHNSQNFLSNFKNSYSKIANILVYRGIVETHLGNYIKAKELTEEGSHIYKAYFSEDYYRNAWSLLLLGETLNQIGENLEAIKALNESLSIYKKRFSENKMMISFLLTTLGKAYIANGDYQKAHDVLEEARLIQSDQLNKKYYRLISWNLEYLGELNITLGQYELAKHYLEEANRIYKENLPENHSNIALFSLHLGDLYLKLGQDIKAKYLIEEGLVNSKKYLPSHHPQIGLAQYYAGNVHRALGSYNKAIKFLEEALINCEENYGKNRIETASVLRSLTEVYLLEGDIKSAENFLQKSMEIYKQKNHPEIYLCLESLSDLNFRKSIETAKNRDMKHSKFLKEQAVNNLNQAQEIVKTHFPKDSPHLKRIQTKIKKLR